MTALARLLGSVGCVLSLVAPSMVPAGASAQYIAIGPPAYGSVSIQIGDFSPQTLRGVAGGPVSLSSVDSSCRGQADVRPSHVIMAPGGGAALRIGVFADSDSTLMVQLPDGRRLCDDDGGEGLNAMIETTTIPGPVYVWVGSYGGGTFPYQLAVTQVGGMPVAPPIGGGRSLFGDLDLGRGFSDPSVLTGSFGGPISASTMSGSCRGYITPQPSHVIMVPGYMPNLRFVGSASSDTTLVVQYPDGHIACDDDSGGAANPLVEGPTGAGAIRVWVGSYSSGNAGPYMLGVTTNPGVNYGNLRAGPPPSMPPVIGAGGIPTNCGMSSAYYGSITVGSSIILGGHTPWSGPDGQGGFVSNDANWAQEMGAWVGQRTIVTSLDGVDTAGCPGVRVQADGGQYFWRIRNASLAMGAPPPPVIVTPPPVVVTPPSAFVRVTLAPQVPVTLYGPGITTSTVAVWTPRGGAPVEFMVQPSRGTVSISATVGGVASQIIEIPASLASSAVVTATRRADGQVLFRAERAPTGADGGQQMLLLVSSTGGAPRVAQQWIGTFADSAPRWSRGR